MPLTCVNLNCGRLCSVASPYDFKEAMKEGSHTAQASAVGGQNQFRRRRSCSRRCIAAACGGAGLATSKTRMRSRMLWCAATARTVARESRLSGARRFCGSAPGTEAVARMLLLALRSLPREGGREESGDGAWPGRARLGGADMVRLSAWPGCSTSKSGPRNASEPGTLSRSRRILGPRAGSALAIRLQRKTR